MYEGMSIGLFGGSFNPAHSGHMHVALTGLRAFELDQIWWMVSPQNPLKPKQPSYESRVKTVEALGLPPKMRISHLETRFGTRYTIDTIKVAKNRFPETRFVFLMGADNLLQMPKWRDWHGIMNALPLGVISRPGKNNSTLKARLGKAASVYRNNRVPELHSGIVKYCNAPAWCYVTPPMNSLSSSALRANGLAASNAE